VICERCGAQQILLLFSWACPTCNPREEPAPSAPELEETTHGGWFVYRNRGPGAVEYVFRTENDATVWRDVAGLSRFPVREVRAPRPFRWRSSTGTSPVDLSARLHSVYSTEEEARASGRHDAVWMI